MARYLSIQTPETRSIFFGFNFRDSVSFSDVTTFNWNSTGAGANFVVVPAESNAD